MASIFDSLPNDNTESFKPSWRGLEPLDDTDSVSQDYKDFSQPVSNHKEVSDVRLERDILRRRINRAVTKVTAAILKIPKNFRRLEKELMLIRRDVELGRSINHKLYKMVPEQEMTELDQVDDHLLNTMLDVEDSVEHYMDTLKVCRAGGRRQSGCNTSVPFDNNISGQSSETSSCHWNTPMCCQHRLVSGSVQSISQSDNESYVGLCSDSYSLSKLDRDLCKSDTSLNSDLIHRINCLQSNIDNLKITSNFAKSVPKIIVSDLSPTVPQSTNRTSVSKPLQTLHCGDHYQRHLQLNENRLLVPQDRPYCSQLSRQTSSSSQSSDDLSRMSFGSEYSDRASSF